MWRVIFKTIVMVVVSAFGFLLSPMFFPFLLVTVFVGWCLPYAWAAARHRPVSAASETSTSPG
jgi:hypothetical protein